MTISSTLLAKLVLIAVATVCAFFLFRAQTDVDIRPWLAAGMIGLGFTSVVLP